MKLLARYILHKLGLDIRKVSSPSMPTYAARRDSLAGLLHQACSVGFRPGTVIDIGAAWGSFSKQCHDIFPDAQYVLVEPLEEYAAVLSKVVATIGRASRETAVAASHSGMAVLNVHHDFVGSSLYTEVEEGTKIDGIPREVPAVTLDSLVAKHHAAPPYLLKVDVQGAELDVLAGGESTLEKAEYVLLEVSLFQFFNRGPLFHDVVTYMRNKGFVPYDLYELQYRPLDYALSQIDVAFVKEAGPFRRIHAYATAEQRAGQNRRLAEYFRKLVPM